MSDLVEFLSHPRRWLQRRKDHKKIIEAARNMKGMEYRWPRVPVQRSSISRFPYDWRESQNRGGESDE